MRSHELKTTSRQLATALRYAESHLAALFETRLRGLFPYDAQVAVIGGSIRDLVLSQLSHVHYEVPTFRDLDIAVLSRDTLKYIRHAAPNVRTNRYGGLKLCIGNLQLDLWCWEQPFPSVVPNYSWEQWLERVDFGINATAFLWPAKRIINHPSWERALALREVSALTSRPISRHRDALRAFGLQCRLRLHDGDSFPTSQAVRHEIDWLLSGSSDEERLDAVRYLVALTKEGRYPVNCVKLLQRLVIQEIGLNASFNLAELIAECEVSPSSRWFSASK